jgi:hypothetical protein
MKRFGHFLIMLCLGLWLIASLSCDHKENNKAESKSVSPVIDKKVKSKPGSTNSDT